MEHKKKPKDNQFENILVTKKLSNYLSNIKEEDKDRAFCFAEKILRKGVQRELNSTLLHETKHAMDFGRLRLSIIPLLLPKIGVPNIAFFWGLNIIYTYLSHIPEHDPNKLIPLWFALAASQLEYFIDPSEIRARRFAKRLKYNPRWNSILSFTPKSDYSRTNIPK